MLRYQCSLVRLCPYRFAWRKAAFVDFYHQVGYEKSEVKSS
ncbi:hypothetical protein HMPREF9019_0670 [Hoylesella timonensis CRIS 5C-B1]|uniref:Uncharacterized protein n=1 Tax=Hoylesella timonensis CRIS 5C-B1 TaxID=679189 RepID=D1VY43_9BACT|nr:hypothetical protein HMPREF9019_0670 [Hoylesella timonensis CRIS 5C-B1]